MVGMEEVIYQTDIPGALMVPVGRDVPNPLALLSNHHFKDLLDALGFAQRASQLTGLPLLYSTAPDFALKEGEPLPEGFRPVKRYVKFMWE